MLPDNQVIHHRVKPPMLVDEVSSTEYYIGVSRNGSVTSRPFWRIQKIWKIGSVWNFGYPDGDQDFKYEWDNRYSYTYSQYI